MWLTINQKMLTPITTGDKITIDMNTILKNKFEDISLLVNNYKCFGEDEQGFNKIYPINIIIGRNNSGKSALLEVIKYAVDTNPDFIKIKHKGKEPEVYITQPVPETVLRSVFPENKSGGGIPGSNHWEYASKWINATVKYRLHADKKKSFVNLVPPFRHTQNVEEHNEHLATRMVNPFSQMTFKHLRAERDITPEAYNSTPTIEENGYGATNFIQYFVNAKEKPSELVEEEVLKALNDIYQPDSSFSRIMVQIDDYSKTWEIYLDEANKGRIPLSHTGSGFKTILLVLILLYLIPFNEGKNLQDYIFALEELENNLHPALQRRLLKYIRECAVHNGCYFFLTTHSNVIIDLFSRDENAQILHVTHDGDKASVTRVQTYVENRGILDDLDVRASDLLQANSVIWIEGPSDRSYVNRWIELWTDGELKEGVHYQCMFYAGRLLAHISAGDPETSNQGAISILRQNRNAIILMDSDSSKADDPINETKNRIADEMKQMGGTVWITEGKEVENYIPPDVIGKHFNKSGLPSLDKYEDIANYLDKHIEQGYGKKFERTKTLFAASICPILTKEDILNNSHLAKMLTQVCKDIRKWNRIPIQMAEE